MVQWQTMTCNGRPVTVKRTSPQIQPPLWTWGIRSLLFGCGGRGMPSAQWPRVSSVLLSERRLLLAWIGGEKRRRDRGAAGKITRHVEGVGGTRRRSPPVVGRVQRRAAGVRHATARDAARE